MTAGGWAMLIGSWAVILALNVYCFIKLLTERPAKPVTTEGRGAASA
jgi:hypothetical protein